MDIKIGTQGLRLEAATDAFVREQVYSALQRFEEQVMSVDVFLKDINGPKGGIDKQVLIRIRLRNRHVIATEMTRANIRAAVVVVTRKAKRAVRRSLKKSQQRHKWRISTGLMEATES